MIILTEKYLKDMQNLSNKMDQVLLQIRERKNAKHQ